jgi:hypothetical protein
LLIPSCLLICPSRVYGQRTNMVDVMWFGDNIHTSTVAPLTYVTSQTPWVDAAISNWVRTATTTGWSFTWSTNSQDIQSVLADLTVSNYYAWVVHVPSIALPRGGATPEIGPGEAGGAFLGLGYYPSKGLYPNPLYGTKIHWLQAYQAVVKAVASSAVDVAGSTGTPFYDGVTLAAGTNYFIDIPATAENEYESNPIATITYQVFPVADSFDQTGTSHSVTIYGGVSWGYTYSAAETTGTAVANPGLFGRNITLDIPTLSGLPYYVFQNTNVSGIYWTPYSSFIGDGSVFHFSAPAANSEQYFKVLNAAE